MSKIKLGKVPVDAGMLMVGDPCYFVGEKASINKRCPDWGKACEEVFCKEENLRAESYDVYGLGIAVPTTYGDGTYDVYLETTPDGKRRLVVDLE